MNQIVACFTFMTDSAKDIPQKITLSSYKNHQDTQEENKQPYQFE